MNSPDLLQNVSACVLAGGKSSRMGRDKAVLSLNGLTMLEYQINKLRRLGFPQVLVSGDYPRASEIAVRDIFPDCGPLGGIYSSLVSCRHNMCFFLSVDCPLLPEPEILKLVEQHIKSPNHITVLSHSGGIEPLIGVYGKEAAEPARRLISRGDFKVRKLFELCPTGMYNYSGPEELLINCNSQADFEQILRLLNRGGA